MIISDVILGNMQFLLVRFSWRYKHNIHVLLKYFSCDDGTLDILDF